MPGSLFLKIFIWFGGAVFIFIIGTFIVGELARPERSQPMRPDPLLKSYAHTATETYEKDGQAGVNSFADRVQHESGIRISIFNDQAQELSGRRPPPGASGVAQRSLQTGVPEFVVGEGAPPLFAQPVTSSGGSRYVMVAEMPVRRGPPPWPHQMLHLILIVLTGALFCYLLARYLTSPVTKLRAATRELANGNLSVRVGPSLGNRRDELVSLGADFDLMAAKIESLIKSQRRLLGDISHELRSPLARLNVALELARQRSGPQAISALERIQRETENLNEMIGQLLALTRLESGAETQRKEEFDLTELTRQIVDDADFEARSRNRSVKLDASESCRIVGTEHLLRRAIENVVRNAVQYTAPATEVEVKLERIQQSENAEPERKRAVLGSGQSPPGNAAVITVRDYGSGVPENALSEIFRPFYRVDDARDREAGGVGLGLAIADRAVRLHGGTVRAANVSPNGLAVTIVLPANTPAAQPTK